MPTPSFSCAPRAYMATPETAPGFWQLGNLWRVMASGIKTGNSFCLLDQLVTPDGGGPGTHAHPSDEGLYVVSGHCTFHAGGATVSAAAGTFICVPRYAEHSFTVDAPDTQLLNFYLPAGFELFVMGFAHPAERNELPPPGVSLAPRHLVEQLSRDYGQIPITGLPGADKPDGPGDMATSPVPGATVPPYGRTAAEAPAFWAAGGLWSLLADGASTDGSFSLFEVQLRAGTEVPVHLHLGMDEVIYVLDGELEMFLGDRIEHAQKGSLVFVPRGSVHAFRVGSAAARCLVLHTPGGFERVVTQLGEPAPKRELPPADWHEPAIPDAQRMRLFADLGLQPIALPGPFTT